MVKTLVLCVDRDDDLGVKAGIKGPVIGREKNLKAAVSLGIKDPEDSDVNAIFAAINTYDNLKNKGEDVEIATICGDVSVGVKSDEILAKQLSEVIEKVKPEEVILVSDGAEDEYIMPIITSRVKVKTLRRVIVKQSKNIESTYYILIKMLSEQKILRKILIPVSLILLAYAFATLIVLAISISLRGAQALDPGSFGASMITLTLGMYFLEKTLNLGKRIINSYNKLKRAFAETKITLISDLIAITLIIYGFSIGYGLAQSGGDVVEKFLLFFNGFLFWFMLGMIVREGGKTLDVYLHGGSFSKSFWITLIFVIATGMVFLAFINSLQYILGYQTMTIISVIIMIIVGAVIGVIAAVLQKIISSQEE